MHPCELCQRHLPEYVSDGGLPGSLAAWVAEHLDACPACREYAERLRCVEEALASYPLRVPPPELSAHVMERVAGGAVERQEAWRWLPWDVWVPLAALMCAVIFAALSLPDPGVAVGVPIVDGGRAWAEWSRGIIDWGTIIARQAQGPDFWGAWIAASLVLLALGLSVAVKGWRHADERVHRQVQDRISHMSEWLGGLLGRA